MTEIIFDWDPAKAASNLKKHGVSFEAATQVFSDPLLLMRQDRIVDSEERWQSIGMAGNQLLLLVAHTIWEETDDGEPYEIIRIISARHVVPRERRDYESERG